MNNKINSHYCKFYEVNKQVDILKVIGEKKGAQGSSP
jgi:hypothetical protein